MPTLELCCDKCNGRFAVDDAAPGDKVACPLCGDINIARDSQVMQGRAVTASLPDATSSGVDAAPDSETARAGLPSKHGPEVDLMRLRPAMLRAKPVRFLSLALGAVGGLVGAVVTVAMGLIPVAIGAGVVALACAITLGVWRVYTHHDGLLITTRRIIDREGLLSKNTSEILLKDIRHVLVKQSFWERLWNVGTLSLSSSSDQGVEIFMKHLAKPHEVKRTIDLYR